MLSGRSLLVFSSELLAPGRCWEGCKAGLSYQAESLIFRRVIQTEMGLCLKRNSLLMPTCLTLWLQPLILASVLTGDMNNLPATTSKEPVKSCMQKMLPAQHSLPHPHAAHSSLCWGTESSISSCSSIAFSMGRTTGRVTVSITGNKFHEENCLPNQRHGKW